MSAAGAALQAHAEILKLARLLERDPSDLAYLQPLALADLVALRERVTDVLWSAHDATLARLAAASRILPTALTATISERAFGPLLSARMAGVLEPERAVEVAAKLSTPFLADIAIELDPRRTSAVISLIAPGDIAEITLELVRRGEHVTMGRFVGHLGDEAIVAAVEVMDDATLLRVVFVLEDKDRLDRLVDLLPDGRLAAVVAAAAEHDLWHEAIDLLGHLSESSRSIVIAALPARRRRQLSRRAREDGGLPARRVPSAHGT